MGSEDSEYWIHSLYNSKYQFYNPVRQNDGHVRFLRRLLKDYGDIPIIPIVVFNNSATIKVNVFNHWVINRRNLLDTIRQYDTIAISDNDIDSIVKLIQDNTKTDSTSKKQHINIPRSNITKPRFVEETIYVLIVVDNWSNVMVNMAVSMVVPITLNANTQHDDHKRIY